MGNIIHEITECSCDKCKNMCKTPCIGTVEDIHKIAAAGFANKLAPSKWAVGLMMGTHNKMIDIIVPLHNEKTGYCSFYSNGLCELHNLGLKPTEGKYATCKEIIIKTKEELMETPLFKAIKTWEV